MIQRLLILPGWNSNSQRWQRVKELLKEKGIEVFILDLPGFGLTPFPQEPWSRNDYLNWIFQKMEEKNWNQFNLLGHSFGGGLAAKMASLYPEKIEKLILCAPAIIRRKNLKTHLFYFFAKIGKKIFSLPGLRKLKPKAQWLIYKLAGTRDYYLADPIMKETMKKISQERDLEFFLEKIKNPTLILWGEKDDVLPLKDAYKIKEKIRNSELKIIQKAKHSPHQEAPLQLAKVIIEFIKS